jgi:hypothetical protein
VTALLVVLADFGTALLSAVVGFGGGVLLFSMANMPTLTKVNGLFLLVTVAALALQAAGPGDAAPVATNRIRLWSARVGRRREPERGAGKVELERRPGNNYRRPGKRSSQPLLRPRSDLFVNTPPGGRS